MSHVACGKPYFKRHPKVSHKCVGWCGCSASTDFPYGGTLIPTQSCVRPRWFLRGVTQIPRELSKDRQQRVQTKPTDGGSGLAYSVVHPALPHKLRCDKSSVGDAAPSRCGKRKRRERRTQDPRRRCVESSGWLAPAWVCQVVMARWVVALPPSVGERVPTSCRSVCANHPAARGWEHNEITVVHDSFAWARLPQSTSIFPS